MGIFRKLIDSEYKELKRFEKIAEEVFALDEEMQALTDDELKLRVPYLEKLVSCYEEVINIMKTHKNVINVYNNF